MKETNKIDPICGMKGTIKHKDYYFCSKHCIKVFEGKQEQTSKTPVIILISILVIALVVSVLYKPFMLPFMGVFFICVSLLKLIDVTGFATGFTQYDLLAMQFSNYAKIYPFIELGLGLLFLLNEMIQFAALIAVFVMTIGIISVGKTLFEKKKIKCACLGTLFKVPLTTFTLVEDIIMLIMALMILL